LLFTSLVLNKYAVAGGCVVLSGLVLIAWHWKAPASGQSWQWWGMAMVIASEATLMGCFIATFWYLRLRVPHWPPHGIPEPKVVVPLVLAGVLLVTSVPMHLAARAIKAGRGSAARAFLLAALIVQSGYFAFEVYDYRNQLETFAVTRNAYSSIYYVLLGADHAHVLVGMLLTAWLLSTMRKGAATGIAWYWHFVNVLTVLVIGTLTAVNVT
ncbi:MAG: cytochrome c oxidase subunit 3, partial [Acidobacteriota bacterium]|nr:cytochrome c oxidase subunit 3 [Acidobacteriota bacterium]